MPPGNIGEAVTATDQPGAGLRLLHLLEHSQQGDGTGGIRLEKFAAAVLAVEGQQLRILAPSNASSGVFSSTAALSL